ncbi:MAG: 30S ribosomal protein S13, partial [candidate division WOR-3 bacterium]
MARLLGVDLPDNKQIVFALPHIYGIGPSNAKKILDTVGVPYNKKVSELTDDELTK